MAADEKVRKPSKPVATTEACFLRPGIERLGTRVPVLESGVFLRVVVRRDDFSMLYSRPAPARHWSRTRRLPRVSAQLLPGEASYCRPAKIASAAPSASNE